MTARTEICRNTGGAFSVNAIFELSRQIRLHRCTGACFFHESPPISNGLLTVHRSGNNKFVNLPNKYRKGSGLSNISTIASALRQPDRIYRADGAGASQGLVAGVDLGGTKVLVGLADLQ